MKNLRETVIEEVVSRLTGIVPQNVIDTVYDALVIALNSVELIERCTEVALTDDAPDRALNRFIATKRIEGLSEKTLHRYRFELQQLLDYFRKPMEKYSTDDLRFYLSWRRQNKNRKQLSNRTLDGMRRIYCSFFSWLFAEQLIPWDPTSALKSIKYKKTIKKPFTPVELQKLREACTSLRDLALVDWLYSTGCRVSEVVSTDIVDVDFDTLECVVTGKGSKERRVYMTSVCAMHLKQYLDSRNDIHDALFVGKGTDRLTKQGIERVLKEVGKRAGVSDVHPHRFRHTLGSELYAKGMPILDIAQILGHEDIGTTKIYCYVDPTAVKQNYHARMAA
jgi:site-specific recombinase XerD